MQLVVISLAMFITSCNRLDLYDYRDLLGDCTFLSYECRDIFLPQNDLPARCISDKNGYVVLREDINRYLETKCWGQR